MSLTHPTTIVIPRWIYQALVRAKFDLLHILDPDKVKEVLSRDDIAEWCYVNDHFKFMKHPLGYYNLSSVLKDTLSSMPYIEDKVLTRLNSDIQLSKYYETINVNHVLLVVLDDGFNTITHSVDTSLEFIRYYLKAHYRILSLQEVSNLPLYSLYIELL